MLLLFLACSEPPPDIPADSPAPVEQSERVHTRYDAPQIGDGFGSTLAIGSSVFVGAPNTSRGRVYSISPATGVSLFFEEPTPGAAGSALAFRTDDELLIGAPLFNDGAGRIYSNTEALQDGGRVLGGRILARGQDLLFTESLGLWENGVYRSVENRIFALEKWGALTVLGHPIGDPALLIGEEGIPRETPYDELGYAICAANFDDDEESELAVGAPGSGKVYIFNLGNSLGEASVLELGEGRFGHALACKDHLLLVGSPSFGDDLRGAAWCFEGSMDTWSIDEPTFQGQAWEQLGAAVAVGTKSMVIGAPGNASTPGSVQHITW